jgi:hypothetical protein
MANPLIGTIPLKAVERSATLNRDAPSGGLCPEQSSARCRRRAGRGPFGSARPEKLCEVLDCQPGGLFAFENPAADVAAVAS